MQRRRILQLLAASAIGGGRTLSASPSSSDAQASHDPVPWVSMVLKRMQTVKPGMTRQALSQVFTTEGGLSQRLRRTFVSRDCPYFKVDVEFQAVGQPDRGRGALAEDGRDTIVKISKPYVEFSIID